MAAGRKAEIGWSTEEILAYLDELKRRVCSGFIAPSVEPLRKKGKIRKTASQLCTALDLHPVLTMRKGEMTLGGVCTGNMERSYARYIRKALKGKRNIDSRVLFINYTGCSAKQLKEFVRQVERYQSFETIILQKTSATISSNCGLGAMGLSYVRKKTELSGFVVSEEPRNED